jgi:hypothetical protein
LSFGASSRAATSLPFAALPSLALPPHLRLPHFRPLLPTLAVGLGTDVTAIDPHYHNLTPNNNVAAHIFGYLVERNEKSQLQPGSRPSGRPIDPLTWNSSCARA